MKNSKPLLYIEINDENFVFFVLESNEQDNFDIVYKSLAPLEGFENNRISDLEKIYEILRKNIHDIEQKCNHIFKETVLILENFDQSFLNLSGYKTLNGSQILRENIIYILNILKSYVDKNEPKKTILQIFNSKFFLDGKELKNLPIGLFGDFYSHELSCILINNNDFKNLNYLLEKCKLQTKKILVKSFIEGTLICEKNSNVDNFFCIQINNEKSKIFYFENNSLKFEQKFNFGTNIIVRDISKITLLNEKNIKKFLSQNQIMEELKSEEFVESEYFVEERYRKIKKKLIYDIISARIQEISEKILLKNINLSNSKTNKNLIFLKIDDEYKFDIFKNLFFSCLSAEQELKIKKLDEFTQSELMKKTCNIVHFGWSSEAIPFTQTRKSVIARLFDTFFN